MGTSGSPRGSRRLIQPAESGDSLHPEFQRNRYQGLQLSPDSVEIKAQDGDPLELEQKVMSEEHPCAS